MGQRRPLFQRSAVVSYSIDETKVIYADLDAQEGVVLNLDTKYYYRLNETGQIVWQAIAAGKKEEDIAVDLSRAYEISEEDALRDVSDLVAQMKKAALIHSSTSEPLAPSASFSVQSARQSKKNSR